MTGLIERTLRRLDEQLAGRVSRPGDPAYVAAAAIWAKPTGPMPRAVVHCRTREDVQKAVRTARDCDLALSVRGGGHDWACRALCDGVVVDLSGMNAVSVDSGERAARISGGARAADVIAQTDPLGLVAVTGSVGAVGMAGLTLGGGYGPLIGRFGLALDNLIAAEVVLADGRTVVADRYNEEDLFWGLRGGGGNFGVVTAMQHRLHALASVRFGIIIYPAAEAKTVLERCADVAALAPDELSVQVGFAAAPDGLPVVLVVPTWCGAPAEGEMWVAPFLKLGTVLSNAVDTISYGTSLSAFDALVVHGRRTFMETCWVPTLDSAGIDVFVDAMGKTVSAGCAMLTHEFKGAASRVPSEATAFGLRRDHVVVEILAGVVGPADEFAERRHRDWARTALASFDGMALPGGYANFLAPGDAARAAISYGHNAERLIKVKRQYDPDNVFNSAIPLPSADAMSEVV